MNAKWASDVWSSRVTWTALAGIAAEIATVVLHKPEYVPLIGFFFTLLAQLFHRDTTARKAEEAQRSIGHTQTLANEAAAAAEEATEAVRTLKREGGP